MGTALGASAILWAAILLTVVLFTSGQMTAFTMAMGQAAAILLTLVGAAMFGLAKRTSG